MRMHDRYARVTPYEMALPGRAFAEERFELIREEADRRGVDIWDPGAFSMLEQSRRAIADIRVEDDNPVAVDFAHRLITGQIGIVILLTGVGLRHLLSAVERHVDRQAEILLFEGAAELAAQRVGEFLV